MAYCTAEQLEKMLPTDLVRQLADDDSSGVADAEPVAEAIDTAAAEIDLYVGRVAELPLADPPAVLRKLNQDIAIWNLYSRYMERIPETREKRYEAAVQMLRAIAEGELSLGIPTDDGEPRAASVSSSRSKVFGPETMEKY